ncbi:nucleoside-diphosphate sugar epimerase [Paenibacillus sp. MMO-177]|uniref:nucleoside-diphosphate sugar epimerase n=1 Tax=Paenibacillus sp. MMO-177 TaxID=3081289 RepID=UPI00301A40A9
MQQIVNEIIEHLSHSHQQMARMMDSKRHIVVRMAEVVKAIPDNNPNFGGTDGLLSNTQALLGGVVSYLTTIAELQETLAAQLTLTVRELGLEEDE